MLLTKKYNEFKNSVEKNFKEEANRSKNLEDELNKKIAFLIQNTDPKAVDSFNEVINFVKDNCNLDLLLENKKKIEEERNQREKQIKELSEAIGNNLVEEVNQRDLAIEEAKKSIENELRQLIEAIGNNLAEEVNQRDLAIEEAKKSIENELTQLIEAIGNNLAEEVNQRDLAIEKAKKSIENELRQLIEAIGNNLAEEVNQRDLAIEEAKTSIQDELNKLVAAVGNNLAAEVQMRGEAITEANDFNRDERVKLANMLQEEFVGLSDETANDLFQKIVLSEELSFKKIEEEVTARIDADENLKSEIELLKLIVSQKNETINQLLSNIQILEDRVNNLEGNSDNNNEN